MRRRRFDLDRFFRRHPSLYLVIRLLIFGVGFSLFTWKCLEWGEIPGRRGGAIRYSEHPWFFIVMIGLFVSGTFFAVTGSILVYLKQSNLLPRDWKIRGMDFRR